MQTVQLFTCLLLINMAAAMYCRGTNASIPCNQPPVTFYWLFNNAGNSISNNSVYTIANVTDASEGFYHCKADHDRSVANLGCFELVLADREPKNNGYCTVVSAALYASVNITCQTEIEVFLRIQQSPKLRTR